MVTVSRQERRNRPIGPAYKWVALSNTTLGYNPMATLVPANVLPALPAANQAHLLGRSFFPNLISPPFLVGLHGAFYLSVVICIIAALASLLRGKRYVHGQGHRTGFC